MQLAERAFNYGCSWQELRKTLFSECQRTNQSRFILDLNGQVCSYYIRLPKLAVKEITCAFAFFCVETVVS